MKTQQLALKAGEITARLRDLIKPQAQPNSSADLNTLIQNAVDLCFSDLKKHSIRLTLGLADNLPPLCVDPIQIEQVLINLISNSIDALQNLPTTLKRQLSIQTQLINRGVEVRVKDNGLGIDQEHQAKILTPFYTTKSMGMGMGLPISRSLIEAHAGKLYFNSQPGKGTTFYFSLPIQTRTEEQEKTVRSVYLYPNNHFSSLKNDLLNGEIFNQKETVNSIDEVVEQSGASFTEEIGPLESLAGEKPTIEKLLADLAELLINDRFISDQLLTQLKNLLPEDQQQDYQCLCQFIHNTDYPNAQLLLKTRMGFSLEPVGGNVHNPRPIILVVDDMRVHQETMTTLLSIEYQVKVAGNGPRALEICQCTPLPELILLDVNMPLMNGYEVYRKLQENLIAWDVPVIFVTAAAYEESEMQGLQLGAVDYITKPINPAILLLRIGNLMRLKQQEKELKRLAQYDTLTGIPNRVLLKDRMKQAIAQANRHQNMLCVCYLDLDGFKLINDTLGHKAGDHVLVEMTQRIGLILREADTIARIGGDEFVVLLPDLNHSNEYTATVKRILECIALPIRIKDQSYYLTASMGINIYPDDKNDWEVLLLHADQAMYFAKQSGKNRYHLYNARHVY